MREANILAAHVAPRGWRNMHLIQRVRAVLPPGAVVAGGRIDAGSGELLGAEQDLARPMSARRRAEFTAGRRYARDALHALGRARAPLLARPSRAPDWPPGCVGTISHGAGACAAVVAARADLATIGLDLEGADKLPDDLVRTVCRPGDPENRAGIERATGTDLPKLVFVVKEAFYKAYHPIAGVFLDFADVTVALDVRARTFEARLANPRLPACAGHRALPGRFGRVQDTVFAVSWLPAAQARG